MTPESEIAAGVPWKEIGAAVGATFVALLAALNGWMRARPAAAAAAAAATPGEDKPKGPTLPITASSMQELCDNVRAISWELHRIADIMGSMSQIMAVRAAAAPARHRGAGEGDDDDE